MTIGQKNRFLKSIEFPSPYGLLSIEDPLAIELIESAPFQRLRGINQYGVVNFIMPTETYSRFEHSLGVYHLIRKARRTREEEIAGLLHDVSHTVFSHVGDYVFEERYPGSSYQDDIHLWFLNESGIGKILKKHGFSSEKVDHKSPGFIALDQSLPSLCADRIEYNLQGGFLRGMLSKEDFLEIYQALDFQGGNWFFNSATPAKKLGKCSLVMTETLWGAPWEGLAYRLTAEALRRAFQIGEISFDEFHFSTDNLVWKKLLSSKDRIIAKRMQSTQNIHSHFTLTSLGDEDILLKLKFRGVNPLVSDRGILKPLTAIDSDFAREFDRVKTVMETGWPIRLINII